MANSKTLLVYVLTVIVYGSSFWVSASTVPLLKEPVAGRPEAASTPQYQKLQQQILPASQQSQETSRTSASPSPSPPSSQTPSIASVPAAAPLQPPQHQSSYGTSNNKNNAFQQKTISIKNAWGLSAGNSDAGPYTSGYGYVSGRTLQQPIPSPKSDYQLMERPSRQSPTNFFEGITPSLQAFFGNGLDIKSIILGGLTTYGVTNFGLPESFNSLIPMRLFRSWLLPEADSAMKSGEKKEKEKITVSLKKESVKNADDERPSEIVKKEVSNQKEPIKEMASLPKNEVVEGPVKDAPGKTKEAELPKSRKKREILLQPDTDLTDLAAMVLSAIQSGECMQRSICILGSQIGASNKGRAAFTLIDKLVPESVQENHYFVTLKKALRSGQGFCDRFRCRLN